MAEVLPDAAGGTARTYMPDAAGNVTHFVDDGVVDPTAQRYEAFGGLRSGNASATRAFAGRPYEGTTGLVNLRARHYDTATGRFLQTDPLGLSAVQAYAYARSNPFVYGDPLGLDPPAVGDKAPAPPPRGPSETALDQGSGGSVDDHRASGGIAEIVAQPARAPVVVNSTAEAIAYFYEGNGEAAELGPDVPESIINSPDQQFRYERIRTGQTPNLFEGRYGIDLTYDGQFFVGQTPIEYQTGCSEGACTTTFTNLDDGFWDILTGDDGAGPDGEYLGGTPYPFLPFSWLRSYPDPRRPAP